MHQMSSQPLPQGDDQQPSTVPDTHWAVKLMIGYLYFVQGFLLGYMDTVPYAYKQLPDYLTMSVFALSSLPFSLKFLTAPILEKYSLLGYGKRKTWIVGSQVMTTLMLALSSFFTSASQAKVFAMVLMVACLSLSWQDIAMDALSLKQLKSPQVMSMIQSGCQSAGLIVGGLVVLKATSWQFAESIGRKHPITTLQYLTLVQAMVMLVPIVLIHLRFKQTRIESQMHASQKSLLQVYKVYKNYLSWNSRYCRIVVFFLFFHQGFNFFIAGYNYELVNAGFSRDTMNSIDNVINIVIIVLIFLFGTQANYFGFNKTTMIFNFCTFALCMYIWIWFPLTVLSYIVFNTLFSFLKNFHFLVTTQLCTYFPERGVTGMIFTMNASASNFGKMVFAQTALLKTVPWRTACLVGLLLQVPIGLCFNPKMFELIEEGDTEVYLDEEEAQEGGEGASPVLKKVSMRDYS